MKRRKSSSRARTARAANMLWFLAAFSAGTSAHAAADPASYSDHFGTTGIASIGRAPVAARADPVVCFRACQLGFAEPHFADEPPDAPFRNRECYSHLMQTSLFLCLRGYCGGAVADDDDSKSAGLARLNRTCTDYVHAPLPPFDRALENYTDDAVARLRRLQRSEAGPDTNLAEVVVLSEQLFENAYDTLTSLNYVRERHFSYSAIMLLFWLAVVVFGSCSRLFEAVVRRSRRRTRTGTRTPTVNRDGYQPLEDSAGDAEARHSTSRRIISRPRVWLQRYLTLPATFGRRTSQDFGWYTVPPRIQTVTIAVFVAMNIAACVMGYRAFEGNLYWPSIFYQMCRYVSDRTGIISFVNFPLIWLFGMRNNVLLWLTGWDFGTYNNFHRWVARVATVQAIVHSIGYTVLVCRDGGLASFFEWWALFWWWTGGVATIFMSLLLGLSLFWMRRNVYEVFLIVHIVFSILILLGMIGHVSIFRGRYDVFFWVCIVIWGFDRALRALRILAFNPLFWTTRAKATYDPKTNIVRLVVPYASSLYQPPPGTYYYLHVLNDKRFWESHPFTFATVASRSSSSSDAISSMSSSSSNSSRRRNKRRAQAQVVELADQSDLSDVQSEHGSQYDPNEASGLLRGGRAAHAQRPTSSHTTLSNASSSPAASAMTFLIRPYDGFTGRLRDQAAAAPAASMRVLVDGPYGHAHHFDDDFDAVLFVVGGSGIVVPLSHLTGLGRARTAAAAVPPRLRAVRIVWAVREAEFAAGVLRDDFGDVFDNDDNDSDVEGGRVALDIYVTQAPRDGGAGADGAADEDSSRLKGPLLDEPLPRGVRVFYDRPDVRGEVECAALGGEAGSRLAVVACGPGRMADEARRAVVDVLGRRGAGDVEYLEESFQW